MNTKLITAFRVVSVLEALSWLGLLIGMFFKWVVESGDLGVKIFGPIHGGIFVLYLVVTLMVAKSQRWNLVWTTLLALGASIPPFATLWFESWAKKTGKLNPVDSPAARV